MGRTAAPRPDRHPVILIEHCAMDHPDPLAFDKSGLCSLRSCRAGWLVCPRNREGALR